MKTIEEKNAVFAAFMNLPRDDDGDYQNSYDVMSYFPQLNYTRSLGELEFDSSMNWQMPVLAKIYRLGFEYTITYDSTTIWAKGEEFITVHGGKHTFEACLKFIEWFNQNK